MADITRFIEKQEIWFPTAFSEIETGRKTSHWIWWIFPNLKGLGESYNSMFYGIEDIDEAKFYYENTYLRENLIKITTAVFESNSSVFKLMGSSTDVKKLLSCMTLFSLVANDTDLFKKVIDKYFKSKPDYKTLEMIGISDKGFQ